MSAVSIKEIIQDAQVVDSTEPLPLLPPDIEQLAYPTDALPPVMEAAVRVYQSYGQQPIPLVACSAMASASLVTQGLVNVSRDPNLTGPVSLNIAVIAESGERKTSADRRMSQAIRAWQQNYIIEHQGDVDTANARLEAHNAEKDGVLAAIKASARKGKNASIQDMEILKAKLDALERGTPYVPVMPALFNEDCTQEALAGRLAHGWPSTSLWSDEAGIIVGGRGMSDESAMRYFSLLNRMWDGNSFERHRTSAQSFSIQGRRLTCSLMMQHAVFNQMLHGKDGIARGIGFMARFLLAWPESTMGTRLYRQVELDCVEMSAWDEKLTSLLQIPLPIENERNMRLQPTALHFTDDARREWIRFMDSIERELSAYGEFSEVQDFASKIAENAARLAAIIWTFQHGPEGQIDKACVLAGIALASWHLEEAKRLMVKTVLPDDIKCAMLLEQWMIRRGTDVTPREISRSAPQKLRDMAVRDAAISMLLERGRLIEVSESNTSLLRVHPALINME